MKKIALILISISFALCVLPAGAKKESYTFDSVEASQPGNRSGFQNDYMVVIYKPDGIHTDGCRGAGGNCRITFQ